MGRGWFDMDLDKMKALLTVSCSISIGILL